MPQVPPLLPLGWPQPASKNLSWVARSGPGSHLVEGAADPPPLSLGNVLRRGVPPTARWWALPQQHSPAIGEPASTEVSQPHRRIWQRVSTRRIHHPGNPAPPAPSSPQATSSFHSPELEADGAYQADLRCRRTEKGRQRGRASRQGQRVAKPSFPDRHIAPGQSS